MELFNAIFIPVLTHFIRVPPPYPQPMLPSPTENNFMNAICSPKLAWNWVTPCTLNSMIYHTLFLYYDFSCIWLLTEPWFLFIRHFNFKSSYLVSHSFFFLPEIQQPILNSNPNQMFLGPIIPQIYKLSEKYYIFIQFLTLIIFSIHHQHFRLIINNGSWSSNLKLFITRIIWVQSYLLWDTLIL